MSLSVTRGGRFRSLPAVAVAAAVLAIGLGSPETISAAEDNLLYDLGLMERTLSRASVRSAFEPKRTWQMRSYSGPDETIAFVDFLTGVLSGYADAIEPPQENWGGADLIKFPYERVG